MTRKGASLLRSPAKSLDQPSVYRRWWHPRHPQALSRPSMQVLADLSAPSHWNALQSLFAAFLVLVVLGAVGTFLLRKVLRKDEEQNRIDAEQIAIMVAGNMVARSPEAGDRLSLKERNSIKAL